MHESQSIYLAVAPSKQAGRAERGASQQPANPSKTAKFHKNRQGADGCELPHSLTSSLSAAFLEFSSSSGTIALNLLWTDAIRVESNSVSCVFDIYHSESLCHRRIRARGAAAIGPIPIS